jgi:hypothetical protein
VPKSRVTTAVLSDIAGRHLRYWGSRWNHAVILDVSWPTVPVDCMPDDKDENGAAVDEAERGTGERGGAYVGGRWYSADEMRAAGRRGSDAVRADIGTCPERGERRFGAIDGPGGVRFVEGGTVRTAGTSPGSKTRRRPEARAAGGVPRTAGTGGHARVRPSLSSGGGGLPDDPYELTLHHSQCPETHN